MRIALLTLLSLLAFAANSIITRFALESTNIDEASFIMLRLVSGALFLWLFLLFKQDKSGWQKGSWLAALALFIYAVSFTYGYGMIAAGTGALLLFGSVQVTMTIAGYRAGERLNNIQGLGFILALIGLAILMLPGITAPPLLGALLMCISGIAWGMYTLQGRGANNPYASTAGNFIKSAPMALILWLSLSISSNHTINLDAFGIAYALLSGIVTSGLGYIIWYSVLPQLKVNHAAIIQLSVPVIVTFLGALLLDEIITIRVIASSLAILFGTYLVLNYKRVNYSQNRQ